MQAKCVVRFSMGFDIMDIVASAGRDSLSRNKPLGPVAADEFGAEWGEGDRLARSGTGGGGLYRREIRTLGLVEEVCEPWLDGGHREAIAGREGAFGSGLGAARSTRRWLCAGKPRCGMPWRMERATGTGVAGTDLWSLYSNAPLRIKNLGRVSGLSSNGRQTADIKAARGPFFRLFLGY